MSSSSVLETFVILFDSDANKVSEGAKEAAQHTQELEEKLTLTDAIAEKLGEHFSELVGEAAKWAAGFFATEALIEGAKGAAEYAEHLGRVSKALGINIEDLSAWSDAVKATGGDANAFQESIKTVTASLAQMDATGRSRIEPFLAELGIHLRDASGHTKNIIQLLPELAEKFKRLAPSESFGIGRKLGLDEGTILLLQRGGEEVKDLLNEVRKIGPVSQEQVEAVEKFNEQLAITSLKMRAVWLRIEAEVLPALTDLAKKTDETTGFIGDNLDTLGVFFGALALIIWGDAIPAAVAWGVSMAGAAVSTLIAVAPILLFGAAIVGLAAVIALAYDDIKTTLAGGDSLGNRFIVWASQSDVFKGAIDAVGDSIKGVIDGFKSLLAGFEDAVGLAEKARNLLHDAPGNISADVNHWVNAGRSALGLATDTPLAAVNGATLAAPAAGPRNNSVQVNVGDVTINTQAADAGGVAEALGSNLNSHLQHTVNLFDDGVLK